MSETEQKKPMHKHQIIGNGKVVIYEIDSECDAINEEIWYAWRDATNKYRKLTYYCDGAKIAESQALPYRPD